MYDFETLVDRSNTGSAKWTSMAQDNPNYGDAVPLSVADMDLKNPPEIVEGLKKALDRLILGYANGDDAYYQAVIDWMKNRHDYEIEKSWIINTPGVVNALYAAVRAFSEEGDGVIIMPPVYPPFYGAIQNTHREVVECPLIKDENAYYRIDFDLLENLAKKEENKVLLFCSPHNPVGRVWTKEEEEKIAQTCLDHDLILVSDEIWSDLIMPGFTHTPMAKAHEEIADRLISCTAPSKTFNIAGMACSQIIVSNPDLHARLDKSLAAMQSRGVNILGFEATKIAYTECEDWLEELLVFLDSNQKYAVQYIQENMAKARVHEAEGSYVLWVDLSGYGPGDEKLYELLSNEAKVFPSKGYSFGREGQDHIRINIALPRKHLEKEMKKLGQAFASL